MNRGRVKKNSKIKKQPLSNFDKGCFYADFYHNLLSVRVVCCKCLVVTYSFSGLLRLMIIAAIPQATPKQA